MKLTIFSVIIKRFYKRIGFLGIAIAILPLSAIAQESNFGKLALNTSNPSGTVTGSTGGTTSLPAIVSNRDRHNKPCLGFGDPRPDHVLVLQQPFPSLSVRVRSSADTTLVIQGPDGIVRCGDATSSNKKDAVITDSNWPAGIYKVWVGTANPGTQRDYTLTVQP
ncbi:hypothetical protein OsccyDRAFT_0943 [Leptolyngbyaceae cyanobacterium JSC-12]|nr:hypothetical protein OsccyDRAFT_0943 [Leptolyngbyaceae cyanobacterium JSC-12]